MHDDLVKLKPNFAELQRCKADRNAKALDLGLHSRSTDVCARFVKLEAEIQVCDIANLFFRIDNKRASIILLGRRISYFGHVYIGSRPQSQRRHLMRF